jgi:membrane protease YdiL (CAAX protease family)
MLKGLYAGASPFTQLIMLGFSMATCLMLLMFTGILLAPLIFGVPLAELTGGIGGAEQNLNLMRYLQILYHLGLFITPAFLASYLFSGTATGYLGLNQTAPANRFWATLLLMLAAVPCINMLAALNEMIVFPKILSGWEQWLKDYEESAGKTTNLFLNVNSAGGMMFNIFMIAILPAIGEELIFRGALQKIFARWTGNIHVAIVVSGFLFSLMHLQFYGFFPRWLLGVMFGYLLVWSGTIWLPVFAHFVFNAMAVVISCLIQKGVIPEQIEVLGANRGDVPVTIVTAAIAVLLLWKIHHSLAKPNTNGQRDFSKNSV